MYKNKKKEGTKLVDTLNNIKRIKNNIQKFINKKYLDT